MTKSKLKISATKNTLIVTVILIQLAIYNTNSFIVGTNQGFSKCYYSDVSHDKTFDVRFGFPRRQRQNCKFKLSIDYLADKDKSEGQQQQHQQKDSQLYNGEFVCYQMSPRQLFVFKHTPNQHQYSGAYRICVQNLQDHNQQTFNTMFQLQISQKFDPTMMYDMIDAPLVESTELLQMETTILFIRRTLSWCQVYTKEAEQIGKQVLKRLSDASDLNYRATYLQIIFLVIYGIVWVLVVRSLNK